MARGAVAPARRARPAAPSPDHAPARKPKRPTHRRHSGRTPSGRAATAPAGKRAAGHRPTAFRPAPATARFPLRVVRAPFVRALRARAGGVLDALLYGQGWIALVGVLLVGIVFFNVDLLQLNRQITGTSERVAKLKRENANLRLDLARLSSSERIQTAAAAEGLVLPAPGDVRYLRANPAVDARRAAKRIVPPDSSVATEPVLAPAATAPPTPPAPEASAPQSTTAPGTATPAAPAETTQPTPGAATGAGTAAPQDAGTTAGTTGAPTG